MTIGISRRSFMSVAEALGTGNVSLKEFSGKAQSKSDAWSDKNHSADEHATNFLKDLTLDEKIQRDSAPDWQAMFAPPESGPGTRATSAGGFIGGVPRLGIPDLQITDCVEGVSGAGMKKRYTEGAPTFVGRSIVWEPPDPLKSRHQESADPGRF